MYPSNKNPRKDGDRTGCSNETPREHAHPGSSFLIPDCCVRCVLNNNKEDSSDGQDEGLRDHDHHHSSIDRYRDKKSEEVSLSEGIPSSLSNTKLQNSSYFIPGITGTARCLDNKTKHGRRKSSHQKDNRSGSLAATDLTTTGSATTFDALPSIEQMNERISCHARCVLNNNKEDSSDGQDEGLRDHDHHHSSIDRYRDKKSEEVSLSEGIQSSQSNTKLQNSSYFIPGITGTARCLDSKTKHRRRKSSRRYNWRDNGSGSVAAMAGSVSTLDVLPSIEQLPSTNIATASSSANHHKRRQFSHYQSLSDSRNMKQPNSGINKSTKTL